MFIVTSTRTGSGRIAPPRSQPQLRPAAPHRIRQAESAQAAPAQFTVAAEDHAPLKARVLLMLALTTTKDRAEIQRMFVEY